MNLEIKRAIRKLAGYPKSSIFVDIEDGARQPQLVGQSFHYETRGGNMIYYPSAYSKKGFSNMVYVPSTRRISVGIDFISTMLDCCTV